MSIQKENGGWQRLEDYCNTGPKGSRLKYTSSIVTMEEELLFIQNERVGLYAMETAIDGWDALMDLSYTQYVDKIEKDLAVNLINGVTGTSDQ